MKRKWGTGLSVFPRPISVYTVPPIRRQTEWSRLKKNYITASSSIHRCAQPDKEPRNIIQLRGEIRGGCTLRQSSGSGLITPSAPVP
ncbi:uncharacterized [Tachysurus ichikawai]